MQGIAVAALTAVGVKEPTGKARVHKTGQGFGYEWTGARRDLTVEPTADPLVAKATIKEASLQRIMVQLHKAKVGMAFNVYASILALALFLLVLPGCWLASRACRFAAPRFWGGAAGLAIFAGLVATA
ncbi:MAG: hypothetical protein FJX31_04305 [Alphaproteobacteria bacterium]|nr:hypothetical protein [Alphaproteobacteria bacterium]